MVRRDDVTACSQMLLQTVRSGGLPVDFDGCCLCSLSQSKRASGLSPLYSIGSSRIRSDEITSHSARFVERVVCNLPVRFVMAPLKSAINLMYGSLRSKVISGLV